MEQPESMENRNKLPRMTSAKKNFLKTYGDLNDRELLIELLWSSRYNAEINKRTRENTSKLVWWLIAIPFIIGFFFLIMTFFGLSAAL